MVWCPPIFTLTDTFFPYTMLFRSRGFNSWTAKVHEIDEMDSFMRNAWNLKSVGDDGAYRRYAFGTGGAAKTVDVLVDDARQGTWALAEGTVHHAAFTVADLDVQAKVTFDIEGLGYTDVSDSKHRGTFE